MSTGMMEDREECRCGVHPAHPLYRTTGEDSGKLFDPIADPIADPGPIPITDISPGQIIFCRECGEEVCVTRVSKGLVYHWDGEKKQERGCGVARDRIWTAADLGEFGPHVLRDLGEAYKLIHGLADRVDALTRFNRVLAADLGIPDWMLFGEDAAARDLVWEMEEGS